MHAVAESLHQPQPNCAVQSPQLLLWPRQKPGQLARQVASDFPEHELAAEPVLSSDSQRPLPRQKPQPARDVHDTQSVKLEHGSPTTIGTGRNEYVTLWSATRNPRTREPIVLPMGIEISSDVDWPGPSAFARSVRVAAPGGDTWLLSLQVPVPPVAQPLTSSLFCSPGRIRSTDFASVVTL